MDALDKRAEMLVTPMARGQRVELASLSDQLLLTAWIAKLALLFDYEQRRHAVPEQIAQRFYKTREPPANAWIWLAACPPLVPLQASGLTWTLGEGDDAGVFLVVIRANHFVAHFVLPLGGRAIKPVRPSFRNAIEQVWPLTYERISWPPPRVLDQIDYAALCVAGFERAEDAALCVAAGWV